MPAWGARLPDQQIWALTAYVSSLRTPGEPEAPR
jgi:mono/diheme cytochrome c family protein